MSDLVGNHEDRFSRDNTQLATALRNEFIFDFMRLQKEADFSRIRENLSSGLPTRSDTNQAVQPQRMARGLKFRI